LEAEVKGLRVLQSHGILDSDGQEAEFAYIIKETK
jgi:hypothetical protein